MGEAGNERFSLENEVMVVNKNKQYHGWGWWDIFNAKFLKDCSQILWLVATGEKMRKEWELKRK